MPNRILKESICTSATINELTPEEEIFFYRLLTACDDYGRMDARPRILRARCFPLRLDTISDADVEVWLARLQEVGLIERYRVEGQLYLQVTTWEKHQQIRAKRSRFPEPSEGETLAASNSNHMISDDCICPRNPIQSNPIQSNHVASPNGDKSVLAAPSQDSARDKVKVLPLKNKNVYSDEFEAFWQIYPNPQGKAAAYEKWKARLKEGVEVKQLTVAAENYRRAKLGTDPQYILHGQTFLGKTRRYEDYLNGAAPYQARAGPVSPGIRPLESLEFQEYLAREQGKR